MDLYQILGINKGATETEIAKAYKNLAFKLHPDRNPGDKESEESFKQVQEAFDVLRDPNKRAEYDRFGTIGRQQPRSAQRPPRPQRPFRHVWEDIFGGNANNQQGPNILAQVEIDLKDIVTGVKKPVKILQKKKCEKCEAKGFTEWQPCQNCSGSGKAFLKQSPFNIFMPCNACHGSGRNGTVKCTDCSGQCFTVTGEKVLTIEVPPGVNEDVQMKVTGEGEPSVGGKNGDLIVSIKIKPHILYTKQGKDIFIDIPVSYTQLVLGDTLTIPSLESTKIDFSVPTGTQDGTRFRIKGQGLPDLKGNKGDLIAILKLEVPMTPKYKNILEELSKCEKEETMPKQEEFLKKVKGEINEP